MNMSLNVQFIIMLTFLAITLEVQSSSRIREDPVPPKRDYRPSKWLTNSALDVWYGNKTFIDIVWREFNDFMLKLTERSDRSITLGQFESNEILDNTTHLFNDDIVRVDVRLSNRKTNETIHTMSFDHPLNVSLFHSLHP